MDVAIVYKADGTIQCADNDPIPVTHHEAELRKIGASEICAKGRVPGPVQVPRLCGAPSGQVNAFAIPRDDWKRIQHGAAGSIGFALWFGAPFPDLQIDRSYDVRHDGLAGSADRSLVTGPVLVRDLIGYACRCYEQGVPLDDKAMPDRINIEIDETGRISNLWLG